jgi:hypothetical protein
MRARLGRAPSADALSEGTPAAWPDPVQRAVRRAHWHQRRTARRTAFVRAAKTGLASALVVLAAAVLALVPVADAFETAAPEPVAITLPEVTFYAEPSAVEAEAASAAAPAAVAAPDDAAQS